jgi:hypothetical protein
VKEDIKENVKEIDLDDYSGKGGIEVELDAGEEDEGMDEYTGDEGYDLEDEEEEIEEPEEEEKLNIEKGYNHLILEDSSKNAFEAIKALTWDDTKGLVLSTMFPSKIDKEYGLEKIEKN